MNYMALALAWRPRVFSELIDQEPTKKALINTLEQKRLHHAYLFTGTRGVGKTSIARLFAKALNCEQGISATPCLSCDACKAVENGNFIDLIEVDGASKTRVEDTRELLENVHYSPTVGRFKIYLIDEVHMLSQHSFNALLKTLEEPPSHVKFLLATTEPQKLPLTILSRCLQFHLQPLSKKAIHQQLQKILQKEQISFDDSALDLLAKAANGSMRDALSLLDQAITSIDKHMGINDVKTLLGYTQKDFAIDIIEAICAYNPLKLIQISKEIARLGANVTYILEEVLIYLHQISVVQILDTKTTDEFSDFEKTIYKLSKKFSPEQIQLFYQIGIKGKEEINLAPTKIIGFEMTLLRMFAFKPLNQERKTLKQSEPSSNDFLQDKLSNKISEATDLNNTSAAQDVKAMQTRVKTEEKSEIKEQTKIENKSFLSQNWQEIIAGLKFSGLALNIMKHSEFIQKEENILKIRLPAESYSSLTPTITSRIEEEFSNYYNEKVKLKVCKTHDNNNLKALEKETQSSFKRDEFLLKLQQEFSANLVKNSITINEK